MKRVVFAVAAVAVAVLFALPSFADEAKTKAGKPAHFTGVITAIDKSTVTVKETTGTGEKTFAVTAKSKFAVGDNIAVTTTTLADLKVGETVKIAYTGDAGNLTATKITLTQLAK